MTLTPMAGRQLDAPFIIEEGRSPTSLLMALYAAFPSTLRLYDQSRRSLLTGGDSLRDLGGRIHLKTKERFSVLMGVSLTTLRTAASWATVFQQQVGRLGYVALSGMISAMQAALASPEGMPIGAPRNVVPPVRDARREAGSGLGGYAPLDPNDFAKLQKEIADILAKTAKLPDTKSPEKVKAVAKREIPEPGAVAKKTVAPPHPSTSTQSGKVAAPSEKEEKTVVKLVVTRSAATKSPLRIHLLIEGT